MIHHELYTSPNITVLAYGTGSYTYTVPNNDYKYIIASNASGGFQTYQSSSINAPTFARNNANIIYSNSGKVTTLSDQYGASGNYGCALRIISIKTPTSGENITFSGSTAGYWRTYYEVVGIK